MPPVAGPVVSMFLLFSLLIMTLLRASAGHTAEDDWKPPEPSDKGWEWARLDTGEWIKGEMIVVHDEIMVFDSDNFDEIEVDWEDVHDLRLIRPRIFRRIGRRTYTGAGEIRDRVLRILTVNGETVEFPADEVVSIVYTSDQEIRNWRVRIGANLAVRSGNTDQQDLTADASIQRETPFHRWSTRYTGTFSRVDSDKTANNHRASTQLDFLITHRAFIRAPSFEFFKDEFQNIATRYTPGVGVGYDLIDNAIVQQEVLIGGGATITKYTGGKREEDAVALFSTTLSFDLPRDIDLDLSYGLQLVVTDLGKTNHNTSAILSIEIWGPLDLEIGAYWDRIESPERDSNNGQRPKSDDFRLTTGLSIEF